MTDAESVIDCHRHALAGTLGDLAGHLDETWRHRLLTSEFALPPPSPHLGVELEGRALPDRASAPDRAGLDERVDAAILVPAQAFATSGWLNHEIAGVFVRCLNDYVVSTWLGADPRFRFAVSVSVHDPATAAAEVRRLGSHPRAVAVCLSPIDVNMGQRHYHPIYEAAQELGLPVIVHPSGFEGSVVGPARIGGIGPRRPEELFTLLPQVAGANLMSLVYSGTFEQFPQLRVVFAGFGVSWIPPVLWRADAEWRGLRVDVPWLTKPPSEYVAGHVRFVVDAACERLDETAWRLMQMLPDELLLYGSDAPFGHHDPEAVVAHAPARLRDSLLRDNANETFARLEQADRRG